MTAAAAGCTGSARAVAGAEEPPASVTTVNTDKGLQGRAQALVMLHSPGTALLAWKSPGCQRRVPRVGRGRRSWQHVWLLALGLTRALGAVGAVEGP